MKRTLLCGVWVLSTLGCGGDDAAPVRDARDAEPTPRDVGSTMPPTTGEGSTMATVDAGEVTPDADATPVDAGMADEMPDAAPSPVVPRAVAEITATGETESTISGVVTFRQEGESVTVLYELQNCPDGTHPTHIHQGMAATIATTRDVIGTEPEGKISPTWSAKMAADASSTPETPTTRASPGPSETLPTRTSWSIRW